MNIDEAWCSSTIGLYWWESLILVIFDVIGVTKLNALAPLSMLLLMTPLSLVVSSLWSPNWLIIFRRDVFWVVPIVLFYWKWLARGMHLESLSFIEDINCVNFDCVWLKRAFDWFSEESLNCLERKIRGELTDVSLLLGEKREFYAFLLFL